jgi:hypothetical protein
VQLLQLVNEGITDLSSFDVRSQAHDISIAINRKWKDGTQQKEEVTCDDVAFFGRMAEIVTQYAKKRRLCSSTVGTVICLRKQKKTDGVLLIRLSTGSLRFAAPGKRSEVLRC